jgi:ubiquinone/menaquinone biosynthesis C-methylase UbiE
MSHFQHIYQHGAADYDRLVSYEDHEGNLTAALTALFPSGAGDVVEFGAGTGRVSVLMAAHARRLLVSDSSAHMLSIAVQKLHALPLLDCNVVVADARSAPLMTACADTTVAGWCYGHNTEWYAADWRTEIGRSLTEMLRVLRPGGTAIIFETLGTGTLEPAAPNAALADYYAWLEAEWGFQRHVIRTDYQFPSLDEAVRLSRFFFGEALATEVEQHEWVTLPECTGMWVLA